MNKNSDNGERINLLGMTRQHLESFFVGINEKPFRAKQIMQWIHHRGITDFNEMSDMSLKLRKTLSQIAEIRLPMMVDERKSADGTRKWLIETSDGGVVESVLIPSGNRATLCVSSQVGCSLDCSFCSTGKQGFQTDLSSAEIVGQLWLANKSFDVFQSGKGRMVTNVVLMGMGEPLLNFDNVVSAMNLMMDDLGYGISKRRVTLSTAGVVPQLDRLSRESDVSLAISLHAPNDHLRSQLVPINRKYPIAELLSSARRYLSSLNDINRRVTIEYILIAGVNDQLEHAIELSKLLKSFPCKINLIPFNPFPGSIYSRPSKRAISRFWKTLVDAGLIVTIRATRGDDIDAACGQLVGRVIDRTQRSTRYDKTNINPVNLRNPL